MLISKLYTVGGNLATLYNCSKALYLNYDPYNPLDLPQNTVRVRTSDSDIPFKDFYATYETATLVPGTTDVYDVYKSGTDLSYLLHNSLNVIEVLGANTTGITNMSSMFERCIWLASVPLFDTSSVTNMSSMFDECEKLTAAPLFNTANVIDMSYMFASCYSLTSVSFFDTSNVTNMSDMFFGCYSLTSVPLFDTSNVTNMDQMFKGCSALTAVLLFNTSKVTDVGGMFANCYNVESGALDLFVQMYTQTNPPTIYGGCFANCGRDTETGAAELAQIPYSWK